MEHKLDCPAVLRYLKEKGYKRTDIEFIKELLKAKKSEVNDIKNELIKNFKEEKG